MADIPSSRPRFTPELVETTTRSVKKFTPQLVEHTTRSSKQQREDSTKLSKPKSKFLPQPIETTTKTSRSRQINGPGQDTGKKSRFHPEPIETTTTSSRERRQEKVKSGTRTPTAVSPRVNHRIAPQLIATSKHTRKVTFAAIEERRHLLLPERLSDLTLRPSTPPGAPSNTPAALPSPEISEREARRLGIPLPKRRLSLDLPLRTHSFKTPELDTIASSESESPVPSRSPSTSPSSTSEESYRHKKGSGWRRHSEAGTPGDVLLQAAKAAERQLREQAQEQALAAFVNDDRHVPVDHFIGYESARPSAAPSPRLGYAENFHRKDTGKWDSDLQFLDMRKFQEKREAQREKERLDKEKRRRRMARQMSDERNFASPWSNPFSPRGARLHSVHVGPTAEELEMERMRNNARPPMLGKDIVFPRCASPDSARFDVTQGSWSVRNKMCYLTEQTSNGPESSEDGGLWSPKPTKPSVQIAPVPSPGSTRGSSPGGLWGGVCHQSNTAQNVQFGPSGLMTPRVEGENPIEIKGPSLNKFMGCGQVVQQFPPSPPPSSNPCVSTLSAKLEAEKAIEAEFDDEFVSQIYNYLSLGYANIGRKYDEELAKISRMDVAELRSDDEMHPSRGYLGADGVVEGVIAGEDQQHCARFKALKKYIHEWARQQPGFANGGNTGGFGVAIRRGSWAI